MSKLDQALDDFFTLPNWQNRCGEWNDVNAAIRAICECRKDAAPVSWSASKPTCAGFYWTKRHDGLLGMQVDQVILIEILGGASLCVFDAVKDTWVKVRDLPVKWSTQLPEPTCRAG